MKSFARAALVGIVALSPPSELPFEHAPAAEAQLGSVNFSTSCTTKTQSTMNEGVALLHSFQYQQAEAAFGRAAEQDPECAMADWGRAISLYHELWDFPDDGTLAKGRGFVEQAQKLGGKTQLERDYISAAAAFYAANEKLTHTSRIEFYSRAMAQVYRDSPQDPDAAAFYALSLVSLAYDEDELPNRHKAIAILEPMFEQHPDHPGLAHYLIHAADTPELAPQGLAAARAYAKIAPDSSHALHMPSHIFTRLGLWQESIDSNVAAAAAAAKATRAQQADASYQLHAMDFLNYAYLQSGQEAKAREVLRDLRTVPGASADDMADHAGWFASRDALELHRWRDAAALEIPNVKLSGQASTYFVRVMGAARSGDPKGARRDLKKLEEATSAERRESKRAGYDTSSGRSIDELEVEAWIEFAEGRGDQALKTLRAAADRQDAEGVDSLAMPAREMLGDMLLELKRSPDALREYRASLKESPNRFDGLWGAAQAAQSAGDLRAAKEYYTKLLNVCPVAADRPELEEARGYLAAK
ncbi:MAG TPA: hypothetical protein VEJ67_02005 [Candidatus Cybelea sp.]|nr:hypothetical protein [Candidatus Cybelea sp.]